MNAFDRLPPVLREELRYCVGEYGCTNILEAVEWGTSPRDVVRHLQRIEGRCTPAEPIRRRGGRKRLTPVERRAARIASRLSRQG